MSKVKKQKIYKKITQQNLPKNENEYKEILGVFLNKIKEVEKSDSKNKDIEKSILLKDIDKLVHFYLLSIDNNINEKLFETRLNDYENFNTMSDYKKKYGEDNGYRKFSKKGLQRIESIEYAIKAITNGIKVNKENVAEVLNYISQELYEFYKEDKSFEEAHDFMKGIKTKIEENQDNGEQVNLFIKGNLDNKTIKEKLTRKTFSMFQVFEEELFKNGKKYDKKVIEDFFSNGFENIENFENETENLIQSEVESFENIVEINGSKISSILLEKDLNDSYQSFKSEEDLPDILKNLNEKLKDFYTLGNETAKNKQAEIISVYLRYFENDFDNDLINDKNEIIKNNELNFEYINNKIVENSYIFIKKKKEKKVNGKKVEETKLNIEPMFEIKNGLLSVKNQAGTGSVDSFYYSRKEQVVIGTSTTVDITGTIEKDQFIRHLYKTKKFNDLINLNISKENKNLKEIMEELSKEEGFEELLKIQDLGVEDTYEKIIEDFGEYDEDIKENVITKNTVDKLFENNKYSFDMLGDLIKDYMSKSMGLHEIFLFLDYQNNYALNYYSSREIIEYFHEKSQTNIKRFQLFEDFKKYQIENNGTINIFRDKLTETMIKGLSNVFNKMDTQDIKELVSKKKNEIIEISNELYTEHFQKEENFEQQLSNIIQEIKQSMIEIFKDNNEINEKIINETITIEKEFKSFLSTFLLVLKKTDNNKLLKMENQYTLYLKQDQNRTLRQEFLDCKYFEIFTKNNALFELLGVTEDRDVYKDKSEDLEKKSEDLEKKLEESKKEIIKTIIKSPQKEMYEYMKTNMVGEGKPISIEEFESNVLIVEEEIFFEILPKEKREVLKTEKEESKMSLSSFIVFKYFPEENGEEKIKNQISKMKEKNLSNLAEETEIELEKTIQEILKEENIDISKMETKELSKEITKGVMNKFGM